VLGLDNAGSRFRPAVLFWQLSPLLRLIGIIDVDCFTHPSSKNFLFRFPWTSFSCASW
jgi:hypothetical protein